MTMRPRPRVALAGSCWPVAAGLWLSSVSHVIQVMSTGLWSTSLLLSYRPDAGDVTCGLPSDMLVTWHVPEGDPPNLYV